MAPRSRCGKDMSDDKAFNTTIRVLCGEILYLTRRSRPSYLLLIIFSAKKEKCPLAG
jgi:hypothetical protein